jgi:GAF domain-containing protein
MTGSRKLRVFLCHASQDKPVIRELYQRLLAEGWIDPWLDEERLLPGHEWDIEIKKAVKAADAVIVCLSNQSVLKEGYVQKEIRFVLDVADEKPEGMMFVVPLRLDECSVPRRLASWHYIDHFPKSRESRSYGRLINSLTLKANTLGIQVDAIADSTTRDSRLRELLDADIVGTTALNEIPATLNKIAEISQTILRAQFVFAFLVDQREIINRHACAGDAPKLADYLTKSPDSKMLIQASINSKQAIRVLDVKKLDAKITLDDHRLQSLLIIPMRLHRLAIGSILVFGKNDEIPFSEDDEFLSSFIGVQAGTAIESNWLYAELRSNSAVSSAAYELSQTFVRVEQVSDGLIAILSAAQKISGAISGGIVLFDSQDRLETAFTFDSGGIHLNSDYPLDLVKQSMDTKQSILVSAEPNAKVFYPLYTQYRQYGALWLDLPSRGGGANFANLQTLASQASISIERLILIREARQQGKLT